MASLGQSGSSLWNKEIIIIDTCSSHSKLPRLHTKSQFIATIHRFSDLYGTIQEMFPEVIVTLSCIPFLLKPFSSACLVTNMRVLLGSRMSKIPCSLSL